MGEFRDPGESAVTEKITQTLFFVSLIPVAEMTTDFFIENTTK
jgi:hypothetical protein